MCLYLKLKRLRRDRALYKLRKSLSLNKKGGNPKLNSRKSKTILKIVCSCFGQVEGQLNLQGLT